MVACHNFDLDAAKKCGFKGIAIPTLASLENNPARVELEAEWGNMLSHQLRLLPAFEEYWKDLPRLLQMISGIPPEEPPAGIPFRADIDMAWRPPRRFADTASSHWLETIRFAAANRLCVNLGYGGTRRIIEPYSLRKTKRGDILLFGVKHQTGEIRAYSLDKMQGAEATNISFTPRFAIELTSISPIPLVSRSIVPSDVHKIGPKRSTRRAPRQIARTASRYYGPRYIYRCPTCQKKFSKKTNDSKLNRHKGRNGMECPGRTGYLVEIKSP